MTERPLSPRHRRDTRGAIYVEVLVAIIPVLIFFFGLLQMAMFHSAKLIVRHAAWRAARSAVVVLEDDPENFEGQPRREVYSTTTAPSSGSTQGFAQSIGGVLGVNLPTAGLGGSENKAGPRLSAIQRAAYMSLAVLAPTPSTLMSNFGMGGALEDTSMATRFLAGMLLYNRAATMLTLRLDGGEIANLVPSDGNVTVHISYLYYCAIPIVNFIMCDTLLEMSGLNQLGDAAQNAYRTIVSEGPQAASAAVEGFQSDLTEPAPPRTPGAAS